MIIANHDEILALNIPPISCYQWAEQAILLKETTLLPPKISMHQDGHVFYNVMPCILPIENCMGVKIISRHPERTDRPSLSSQILLYDLQTGELIAILDGSYITAMRTGAVAAHAVHTFSNPDFSQIGLLGLGVTATATMDVIAKLYPDKKITINLLKYKQQEESFVVNVKLVSTYRTVVSHAKLTPKRDEKVRT